MRSLRVVLTVLLVASGCVTQGTYDLLMHEKEGVEESLSTRNKELSESERKLLAANNHGKDLELALADEREKVAASDGRIARLLAEQAAASKDKNKLQASIEEMTVAISDLEKRRAAAEARVNEFKSLLAKFKSLIDAGKLKVRIVDGRMVVVLATDILFASGSANLSKDGKAALSEVAQVLASIEKRSFQVEGHTDNVPIFTAQYPSNWELAAARAINVLKAMIDAGLPVGRVSAASFGDSRPTVTNDSTENKALNRRIEIIIVPDLSGLPGFDELQKVEKSG